MHKEQTEQESIRLVLLLTHGCCLRCKYCFVQQSKGFMPEDVLLKSVDFLLSSEKSKLQLHFFGGEPLLVPFGLIRRGITYAVNNAKKLGKEIEVIITTNGICLDKEKIDFFNRYKKNIILELSLDGDRKAQNLNRPQSNKSRDSYSLIVKNFRFILDSGVDKRISMVVSPYTVDNLISNFNHLMGLGFTKIFMMTACGVNWSKEKLDLLKKNLSKIEDYLFRKIFNKEVYLINLKDWFSPFRMNTELVVDLDGKIYPACISYLLHNEKDKKKFLLGDINHIKEGIDFFDKRRISNEEAMYVIFKENKVLKYLKNNIAAGMIMAKFVERLNKKLHMKGLFFDT